jgi:hypothetical protein
MNNVAFRRRGRIGVSLTGKKVKLFQYTSRRSLGRGAIAATDRYE